jgi:hypothetical protein
MRLPLIAACLALLSASGCTSMKTAPASAPPAGAQVSSAPDSGPQAIRPQPPAAPAQPAVSSVDGAGASSAAAADRTAAAAAPPSTSSATSSTAAKAASPSGEHPIKQAGEVALTRPPAVATVSNKPAAPAPLNLADLEQRLRDTHAIGVFTKLSLKNQVDDLLNEFRTLYKGPDKRPTAQLRQQYDLLLLKVLTLLQDSDPSLAAAISSSREAIWGILSDPDKFAKI